MSDLPIRTSNDLSLAVAALDQELSAQSRSHRRASAHLLPIVMLPRHVQPKFRGIFWRQWAVISSFIIGYLFLVGFLTLRSAQEQGATSWNDPRVTAAFLSKVLEWLFVPGPKLQTTVVGGTTTYTLPGGEVLNWLATVGIYILGWGSIFSIPTFFIGKLLAQAEARDSATREHHQEEEKKIALASVEGRLEIQAKSFHAIFTHTSDPASELLIKGFQSAGAHQPWVVIQSGEKYNTTNDLAEHVYFPHLTNNADYDLLLHAERLRHNLVLILTQRPGYKFLCDPNNLRELDIPPENVVTFVENIRSRTEQKTNFVIIGSADAKTTSAPFRGDHQQEAASLLEVASEIHADFIDTDEVVIREMYRRSQGKPIYLEFTGTPERIATYQQRMRHLVQRLANKYPLVFSEGNVVPTGGVFFIGKAVEGVALTKKRLEFFETSLPHTIIFEDISRYREVEALGFQPLCVNYEVVKEVLRVTLESGKMRNHDHIIST